jgi:hypothetical protein
MTYFNEYYYPQLRRQKSIDKLTNKILKVLLLLTSIGFLATYFRFLFILN